MDEELFLPVLSHFENGNFWTASGGALRYKVVPDTGESPRLTAEVWEGPWRYQDSTVEETKEFPLSEEGLEELRTVLDDTWVLWWGVSNSIPMKDREDHPFWLEIYTEERIPAATFCLGSDGLRYEGKLRFRPLNADLLAALGLHTRQAAPAAAKQPAPLSDTERRVLAGIGPKPVGIEELCVSTGLPMSALLGTLMKLELTGRVYKQPGQRYVLR